jgi:hypothetical protein
MNLPGGATAKLSTFSHEEAEEICGSSSSLRQVWPQGPPELSAYDICSMMVRRASSALRRPLRSTICRDGARFALWFALMDNPRAISTPGWSCPSGGSDEGLCDHPGLMAGLTGVTSGAPPRFLLFKGECEPEQVSDLLPALDCAGETTGFFVDLMTVGHQVAQRAQRPLVILTVDRRIRRER